MKTKKNLILIDSNALVHRAFHALPPLSKKDGTLTNAVYGYALTLLSVLDKFKPDYIAATFDLAGPTFRHEQYEEYKATRKKAPDELYEQIPMVKEMLHAFNIPIYEKQGFEADDVIGTIAKDPMIDGNVEKIIVTGDLDTLQLIDEHTKVFTLRRGITDTVTYDEAAVKERYGLEPWQMIEYKSLRGDTADNIPGVKGIGEKTAIELLLKYKDLAGVYQNLEHISSASVRKKLEAGEASAKMSRELATIQTNVPITFTLEKCVADDYDRQVLIDFFHQMEFFTLAKRISGGEKKESKNQKSNIKTAKQSGKEKATTVQGIRGAIRKIERVAQMEDIRKSIRSVQSFAFSFFVDDGRSIRGIGISVPQHDEKEVYFIPKEFFGQFEEVFADESILKIGYDIKTSLKLLADQDVEKVKTVLRSFDDVQIMAYLLSAGSVNDLEKLVFEEFGAPLQYKRDKKGQMSLIAAGEDEAWKESVEQAFWIGKLGQSYKKRLIEISQEQHDRKEGMNLVGTIETVYQEQEKPLVSILAQMEMIGVEANKQSLQQVSKEAEQELIQLEKDIYQHAGQHFNINSPSQLAPILYEKLGIPTELIKRGKTGYSTDAEQLAKIREFHPIVPLIEQYRELFKIKTTYADSLPELIGSDGRIHTSFNQAVTATGRLSSSDPNLQNIPKRGKLAGLIRESFVAAKGYQLVAVDYSQIDLRAAAHLANDKRMIEAFETGKDIHRATASWVNNMKEDEVTDEQRREAKSLNFGVLYGMGIYGFMRDSGVSRERAEVFIDQYMKRFSGIKQFLDETKRFAYEHGYVETELGRRRYIPGINAGNRQLRAAAERMAINLPVQGLSADIMKLAMVAVQQEVLSQYNINDARMILQIHDELIFEVKEQLVERFGMQVKEVMEQVYPLRVPLVVEVEQGNTWAEV